MNNIRPRRVEKGEVIFRQGNPASSIYMIEAGTVKISAVSREGRRGLAEICGKGDVIGEHALIGADHEADATAAEDSVIRPITADALRRRVASDPEWAVQLVGALARRLCRMSATVHASTVLDTSGRIASRLCHLADAHGGGGPLGTVLRPLLTQSELAGMAGCARETVSKTLGDFRRRGWVRSRAGRLVIVDREALGARAGL